VVAAALSAFDVAATIWTEQDGATPLGELLDASVAAIKRSAGEGEQGHAGAVVA